MRCLAGVIFLASCAMLTPVAVEEEAGIEHPASVEKPAPDPEQPASRPENRRPKSRQPAAPAPAAAPPPAFEVSACANLDAGDLKETIKAKLDCITESTK